MPKFEHFEPYALRRLVPGYERSERPALRRYVSELEHLERCARRGPDICGFPVIDAARSSSRRPHAHRFDPSACLPADLTYAPRFNHSACMPADLTRVPPLPVQSMHAEPEILLQAEGLARSHGQVESVRELSLKLARGDVMALLGLNGAGKSTTLRLLCGVLAPDAGNVTVVGHSLEDEPLAARGCLGYLPDHPPLYPDMRVRDYLVLAARLRRVPPTEVKGQVENVLARCDLESVGARRIRQLSKGFRQRVGLAQAVIHEPAVVLLDEPGSGLDPQQMEGMRELITSLGRHGAVIFSTHLLGEAEAVCNRVAVMHEGTLVADQPIDTDRQALASLFTNLTSHGTAPATNSGSGSIGTAGGSTGTP